MGFEIEIEKDVLQQQLEQNKERYVSTRKVLVEAYQKKVEIYQKEYTVYSMKVIEGTLQEDDEQPMPPVIPEDRTDTYDWYIKMVQAHSYPKLTIDDQMFKKLYLDKWDFIRSHIMAMTSWSTSTSTWDGSMMADALTAYQGGET